MASDEISHEGLVKSVDPHTTVVEIVSRTACSSCKAASLCTSAEAVKKEIYVPTDRSGSFSPGDSVEVVLKKNMGERAVWISYVIPLAILLILVVSLLSAGVDELVSGLSGIAGVGLYYFILYLFRDRIGKGYAFYIRRKN